MMTVCHSREKHSTLDDPEVRECPVFYSFVRVSSLSFCNGIIKEVKSVKLQIFIILRHLVRCLYMHVHTVKEAKLHESLK